MPHALLLPATTGAGTAVAAFSHKPSVTVSTIKTEGGEMTQTQKSASDWQSVLGLTGLLSWLLMFGVVDYSHDMLMSKSGGGPAWATTYEVSAGYVLGFVGALAVWLLWQLAQGPVPDILSESPVMRGLSALGLVAVLASALAGLVMHNLGGFSLTYDSAFVVGILVVSFGVIPLYRNWRS
ncbi:MAG: hypothetical protein ACK59Y_10195 [Betaproteobacteria bacterium]